MESLLDGLQDVVTAEPGVEVQPDPAQPDDAAIETRLALEISELWCSHIRLAGSRKATATEIRQIRARLAERLHQTKSLLCRPDLGRSSQWQGWLRQQGIPRSTADRLVARYDETLCRHSESMPSGAPSDPVQPTVEELAKGVWQRVGKVLSTDEMVIRFIGCFVEASGVGHEQRSEGLMIFTPVRKIADGVIGTDAAAEITCPTPQPAESGDANPADAPAADPDPQLSDDVPAAADELPASAPATGPAPQPSDGTPAAVEGPAAETAATPTETGQAPAAADAGSGGVA